MLALAPQAVALMDNRTSSRSLLQFGAVAAGLLLAPQPAQARPAGPALAVLAAKPSKPTDFTATAGNGRVTLAWGKPCNASITGYQLQQRKGSGNWGRWTNISGSNLRSRSHTVKGLENGSRYRFRIRARSDAGNSTPSDVKSATPNPGGGFSFRIPATILDADCEPVLEPIEDRTIRQGQTVDIRAVATDGDGDAVSYVWTRKAGERTPALPPGVNLSAAHLNFTPPGTGAYTMTVTANDGNGYRDTEDVTITVVPAATVAAPRVVTAPEGGGAAVVRITTDTAFGVSTTFNVTYADGTATGSADPAGGDYDNNAVTSITFGPSETAKTIRIPINNDGLDEPDETFTVTIAAASSLPAGFNLGQAVTTVTIRDDDSTPVLEQIDDITIKQGRTVDIRAVATDADGDPISYVWTRKAGERTPALPPGVTLAVDRLNFTPPGTGVYTMTVTANDGNGNTATEDVTITVSDTDVVAAPPIRSVGEGDGSATVTVRATEAFGQATTFNVTCADGTATGSADPAGGDYDNNAVTSITFGPSETVKTIRIPINNDGLDEPDETFTVTIALANGNGLPAGFTLGNTTTTVTIVDDDATPVPADNDDEPSVPTQPPVVTAPPAKPTNLTATPGDATVTLNWDNPNNPVITNWQYTQKEEDGSYGPWMDVPGSNAASTSHTVTDLTNGVLYTFKVRGVNPAGPGEPSNEASATPFSLEGAPPADRAHKAPKQTVAATSRALLGMAAATLGERLECDPVTHHDNGSIADQTLHIVKELLGINGAALPTDLNLEALGERLLSQSFQIAPSTTTRGEGNGEEWCPSARQRSWALWGAGELASYAGNDDEEALSYDGSLKTAWLGADHQFTNRWLAGVALSFSSGESDYSHHKTDGSEDGGKMETRLTTFYPYGAVQLSERLRLRGMAGMGFGTQQHQQSKGEVEGDLRLRIGVIGFAHELDPIGDLQLSVAGDLGLAKSVTKWEAMEDLSVSLHRIRLGINSSFPLAENTTGHLNLKGRIDGGDLHMNAAEIVAGLHYGKERFSGFLQGRQTCAFDGSYAESALTAQLRLTANTDGTGLSWELQPSYGAGNGDLALADGPALWTDEQLEALAGSNPSPSGETALSSRVAYGIRLQPFELLLTPFTEVRLSEGNRHRMGLALETSSWNLELSSSTENTANPSSITKTELTFSRRL